jgi:Undecaprenyl-phosphate galactose phosphotransferase WbaP
MSASAARALSPVMPVFSQYRWTMLGVIVVADFFAVSTAGCVAVFSRLLLPGQFLLADYLPFVWSVLMFGAVFTAVGLYPGIALNPVEEFRRIIRGVSISYLLIISGTFFIREANSYSRLVFLFSWMLSIVLVVLFRSLVREYCCRMSWWGLPVVILGGGRTGHMVMDILNRNPGLGLRAVALLDGEADRPSLTIHRPNGPINGQLSLAPSFAKERGVRYAILAMPGLSAKELSRVVHRYAHCFPHLLIIPNLFGLSTLWVSAMDVGGVLGLELSQTLVRPGARFLKRMIDLVVGVAVTVALAPLMGVIYVAIRIGSKGPAIYGQTRLGLDGEPFVAWKFRSMLVGADALLEAHLARNPELRAEWERDHKLKDDPRVTPVGRMLRKTSLDELPQVWNILRGEMSLVGPRPIVRAEIVKYGDCYELYQKVRPGLTGLWQVSGRNNTTYQQRVAFDEYYVRNWSVWLDLHIFIRTVKTVLLGEGAY